MLDHCVLATDVACRLASDCRSAETCYLTGLSAGPRGNEELRAICLPLHGGPEE